MASLRAEDGSAGHYHAALLMTNTARTSCTLSSPRGLQMLASDGRPLVTSVRSDDSTGRAIPVLLATSHRASIQVSWVEISSGEACVMPARLQVFTPDDAQPLVVAWPPDHDLVCGGGVLTIQPARPGLPRY